MGPVNPVPLDPRDCSVHLSLLLSNATTGCAPNQTRDAVRGALLAVASLRMLLVNPSAISTIDTTRSRFADAGVSCFGCG